MEQKTYDHYGDLKVEEFVDQLESNPEECKRMHALVGLLPEGTRSVLDVGAGHGLLLNELQTKVDKCKGVEITENKVRFASDTFGLSMVLGSADNLEFPPMSFDTVYCCEVLEHLPYQTYEKAISELERVARKHIIISVPNNEIRLRTKCPYCQTLFYPNYHMRSFNDHAMISLFNEFHLERHLKAGSTPSLGILPVFLASEIRRRYPKLGYCPACGYHKSSNLKLEDSRKHSFRKSIRSMLPKKPRWHVALYSRIEDR